MISWKERVLLTAEYGLGVIVPGGMFNAVCTILLATAFSYAGIMYALLFKCVFTATVMFLRAQFEQRDAVFFYVNLGLTKHGMLIRVLSADFLALAILLTIIAVLQ